MLLNLVKVQKEEVVKISIMGEEDIVHVVVYIEVDDILEEGDVVDLARGKTIKEELEIILGPPEEVVIIIKK